MITGRFLTSLAGQIFGVLVGLAVISACTLETSYSSPKPLSLAGTQWKLKTLGKVTVDDVTRPLTLNIDDTRLNGYTGCNRFFSGYTASADGVFSAGTIGTTKMACANGRDKLEYDYLQQLSKAERYAITSNQLHLLDGKRQILLVYQTNKPGK